MAKRVLIVEDEKLLGLMLAENVKGLPSFAVANVVTNGEEAVMAAKKERPDAILMDISLDGMLDGIEAARIIRAEQEVPILFLPATRAHPSINGRTISTQLASPSTNWTPPRPSKRPYPPSCNNLQGISPFAPLY